MRGAEWLQVDIIGQELKPDGSKRGDPLVRRKHCSHQFRGGAHRVRSHLLGTKDGVKA